jgi:hypothetical protein
MGYSQPAPIDFELLHLRGALMRLEEVGETSSRTIECLKRIVALRIVELEATRRVIAAPSRRLINEPVIATP